MNDVDVKRKLRNIVDDCIVKIDLSYQVECTNDHHDDKWIIRFVPDQKGIAP